MDLKETCKQLTDTVYISLKLLILEGSNECKNNIYLLSRSTIRERRSRFSHRENLRELTRTKIKKQKKKQFRFSHDFYL